MKETLGGISDQVTFKMPSTYENLLAHGNGWRRLGVLCGGGRYREDTSVCSRENSWCRKAKLVLKLFQRGNMYSVRSTKTGLVAVRL